MKRNKPLLDENDEIYKKLEKVRGFTRLCAKRFGRRNSWQELENEAALKLLKIGSTGTEIDDAKLITIIRQCGVEMWRRTKRHYNRRESFESAIISRESNRYCSDGFQKTVEQAELCDYTIGLFKSETQELVRQHYLNGLPWNEVAMTSGRALEDIKSAVKREKKIICEKHAKELGYE